VRPAGTDRPAARPASGSRRPAGRGSRALGDQQIGTRLDRREDQGGGHCRRIQDRGRPEAPAARGSGPRGRSRAAAVGVEQQDLPHPLAILPLGDSPRARGAAAPRGPPAKPASGFARGHDRYRREVTVAGEQARRRGDAVHETLEADQRLARALSSSLRSWAWNIPWRARGLHPVQDLPDDEADDQTDQHGNSGIGTRRSRRREQGGGVGGVTGMRLASGLVQGGPGIIEPHRTPDQWTGEDPGPDATRAPPDLKPIPRDATGSGWDTTNVD